MNLWKAAIWEKENIRSKLSQMGSKQWAVLLLVGLLLAVITLPVSGDKEKSSSRGLMTDNIQKADTTVGKTELEEKLESLLSSVEGVGQVRVILMIEDGKASGGFYDSGGEKVEGVLIAAQGADNYVTVQNIQQAVMALFQVEAHKIKIMKMK